MSPVTPLRALRRRPDPSPVFEPGVDVAPGRWTGGPDGVLVLHGFTGSPHSMRPWARHLAAAGFAVEMPLLPGHGRTVEEMGRCRWQDWTRAVDEAYWRLRARTDRVAVAGLSMGGTLALHLAARRPVAAVSLVNPAVVSPTPLTALAGPVSRVLPTAPGLRNDIALPDVVEGAYARVPVAAAGELHRLLAATRRGLPGISAPTQLFRSTTDHVVPEASVAALERGLRRAPETHRLPRSWHVATLDHDAPQIFDLSLEFFDHHGLRRTPGTAEPLED